ncbi:LCP family protein [Streptomyces aidingensis]|uniref:Cell envelope-related function transcriptional attenuator common domain-containing protein n=1 Tax=Streptomyces aidingensis TaxID=910347 RepID=A0A1I1E513_9ACTN|nr:LCP family protein [Streptomyces aidingensis]SFB82329.1 cell envelope-related function transcriptional attenuator common domain-containing protein [Streptomyces aidingensis]
METGGDGGRSLTDAVRDTSASEVPARAGTQDRGRRDEGAAADPTPRPRPDTPDTDADGAVVGNGVGNGDGGKTGRGAPAKRRRRRWPLVLAGVTAALLGLVLAGAGWLWWKTEQTFDSVDRIPDALPDLPEEEQPAPSAGDAQIYLLIGLDAEWEPDAEPGPAWQAGAARSDTMMLMHIPGDRSSATLVSIPRDTWVEIPGHGEAKLNAAYSWGGTPLLVQTVQDYTDLRIDHLAVLDWSGFRELTDAVGGVTIDGERMTGEQALAYVRERRNLPEGDFDRTRRQQHFLRSLLAQTLSGGTMTDMGRLNGLMETVGEVVSVDDRLSNGDLRTLAWELRSLRSSEVNFMNAPVIGTDTVQGQSVVLLDWEAAAPLWDAMRDDTMDEFLASGDAPPLLGEAVR